MNITTPIIETGRWNDNTFTLDSNGHLVFSPMSEEELQNNPQPAEFYNTPLSKCISQKAFHTVQTIDFEPGCVCNHTTSLKNLFSNCPANRINIEHLDISSITDMSGMFQSCSQVETIQMQLLPKKLQNASHMFDDCERLQHINTNQWIAPQLKYMDYMFSDCRVLKSINLSHLFNDPCTKPHIITLQCMFINCFSLESIQMFQGEFFAYNCESMFINCANLSQIDLSGITINSNISRSKHPCMSTAYMFASCIKLKVLRFFNASNLILNDTQHMFAHCEYLHTIQLLDCSIQSYSIESMFEFCIHLKNLFIPGSHTFCNAVCAFRNCKALSCLDLSNWTILPPENSLNPNNLMLMISQCPNLTEFHSFCGSVSKLNCSYMFHDCPKLITIKLNSIHLSNNSQLIGNYMFENCISLQTVNLPSAENLYLTNSCFMFSCCYHLKHLDLSNININGEINFMFDQCWNLQSITFSNNNEPQSLNSTFKDCMQLKHLNLSTLIPNTTCNFEYTFKNCKNLQTVILAKPKRIYRNKFYNTFNDCNQLRFINIFPDFKPEMYHQMNLPAETILQCSQTLKNKIPSPYAQLKELLKVPSYHPIIPTLLEQYDLSDQQLKRLEKIVINPTTQIDPVSKAACLQFFHKHLSDK